MGHLPAADMPVRCDGFVTRCLSLPSQAPSGTNDADATAAAVRAAAQSYKTVTAGSTDAREKQLSHATPVANPIQGNSVPLGYAAAHSSADFTGAASSARVTEPSTAGQPHPKRLLLASTTQARTAASAPAQVKPATSTDGPAPTMNAPIWRRLLRATAAAAKATASAVATTSTYTNSATTVASTHGPAALMNAPIYNDEGFRRLLLSFDNVKASTVSAATAARSYNGPAPQMNAPIWKRLLLSTSAVKATTAAQSARSAVEKGTGPTLSGPPSMNAPIFRRSLHAAAATQASTATAAAHKVSAGPALAGMDGPMTSMNSPVDDAF